MEKDNALTIGRRIRSLREDRKMSQKDLAEALHISQGRISQIERGAEIPQSLVSSLCAVFKVSSDFLYTGSSSDSIKTSPAHLDRGELYQNAVDKLLRDHGYKKVKHPIVSFKCDMTALKAEPAYKAYSKILRTHDCTLSVHSKEIMDTDFITGTKELIVPAINYTFALRCLYIGSGWVLEAFETSRKLSSYQPGDLPDIPSTPEFSDEVGFEPFHFSMFSPRDGYNVYDNPKDENDPILILPDDMSRYNKACAKAIAEAHYVPESPNDTYWVKRYCPKEIQYDDDGLIDRIHEFVRFQDLIFKGISGKSLSPAIYKAEKGHRCFNTVIFSDREHSLSRFSSLEILCDAEHTVSFKVDDRIITGEQFLNLLTSYEGFHMNIEMEDR